MIVTIVSPGMEHDGDTLKTKSLGGSETAAIQLAEAFAKVRDIYGNKNRVTVFSPCEGAKVINDVNYFPVQSAQAFIQGADIDILIVSRWQEPLMRPVNAKVVLYWCHDLALKRFAGQVRGIMYQIDKLLVMSNFQKEQYKKVYDLPDEMFSVIRNGIDLDLFNLPERKRNKGEMVYCARPERGLENLVGPDGIMERLFKSGSPVTLSVAHYDNTTKEMAPYYNFLWDRCKLLPNVNLIGSLTKRQLYDLYSRAWLYVYPTEFEEISCISAMEAMACGLPFLTTPVAALTETLDPEAAIFIEGPASGEKCKAEFAKNIRYLMDNDSKMKAMSEAGKKKGLSLGWKEVASDLIYVADEVMRNKTSDPARLYKHFLRYSDIEACMMLGDVPGAEKEVAFVKESYAFTESPEAYREQYKKVDGYIDETNRGASVDHYPMSENEPRWLTMKDFLEANKGKFRTVLDYGCWIGHQTIRMANILNNAVVCGIDVNSDNIKLAHECKKLHSAHGNVDFVVGDEMLEVKNAPSPLGGPFDLVVCNEVLEHVMDPYGLIRKLEAACSQGGTIFITTPFGPWESESYKTFPYRCHIRHFEMNDLLEVFGEKENLQVFYRQTGTSKEGIPLGHSYVIYTNNPDRKTGTVNYERKLAYQAPRETLSVCMIAYNAESMLHRCLKSVQDIADEIIVAVDPKTHDTTGLIAEYYGAKVIAGLDPREEGFDGARNHSIKKAKGDWILWIDSDEELLQAENILKYLRSSYLNGYALQQHHLSVDPPTALRPDLPIRLFRNRKGIRFFGYVHEHPELELNKGVGPCVGIADAWLAHDGYLTEGIRRQRFIRNIDLLVEDRKRYPDRELGHFLWLRDLIHMIRYRMDMTGGQMDAQCVAWAKEAKDLFEKKYLLDHRSPMLMEALGYYSEANQFLNLGVPMKMKFHTQETGEIDVSARFPDGKTAGIFLSGLAETILPNMEDKYA
jgi:glycosyltransferase involved in cell wall biosynthesis/2-polyprenyl-3-methyl-5-hydroxy-6-metoxy-1,4-benzoquinol methylase